MQQAETAVFGHNEPMLKILQDFPNIPFLSDVTTVRRRKLPVSEETQQFCPPRTGPTPMIHWIRQNSHQSLAGGFAFLVASVGVIWGLFGMQRGPAPESIARGRQLFEHQWVVDDGLARGGDGLGPVFNATSCVACHSQGGVGGGGPNERNVTAFEVIPNRLSSEHHAGVIHSSATSPALKETKEQVRSVYPIVPGGLRVEGNCTVRFDTLDPLIFTQINTPTLFGAGQIDKISGWTIKHNRVQRTLSSAVAEVSGDFRKSSSGRVRILPDGRVGQFGWKAQFATLDEFVATACAVEVGLSNPVRRQDQSGKHVEDRTAVLDMSHQELRDLTAFCEMLEQPVQILPDRSDAREQVSRGEAFFTKIGCVNCHTPNLGGVEGIYSDLCLHVVVADDDPIYEEFLEVPLPEELCGPDEWKTPPLWAVSDTAPYMHDGSAATLDAAILRSSWRSKDGDETVHQQRAVRPR